MRHRLPKRAIHGGSVGEFLAEVAEGTGLDAPGARRITEAVLGTLAERIPGAEVVDLISRLPLRLRAASERA